MLLNFEFENYRSFQGLSNLSLKANSSNQKNNNLYASKTDAEQDFRMLKTAVIYGPNASGKSNTIRALFEVLNLIDNKPNVDENLRIYDPFTFDSKSMDNPSRFSLEFIGPLNLKYHYSFTVYKNTIIKECLDYWPNIRKTNLFERNTEEKDSLKTHRGILMENKKEITVFPNQLILSKFAEDPHEILTKVYLYFKDYDVINPKNQSHSKFLEKKASENLYNNKSLQDKVSKLISRADTKVKHIEIEKDKNENNSYSVFGVHDYINESGKKINKRMSLLEESIGTQSLYVLGSKIVNTIDKGSVLIIDEMDTSLHPFITKMIVQLFHSQSINKNNAQLIFTTHDVSLLDKDLIRRDQVWITEKNKEGQTELFSLQDFDGLREDSPFEKWYLAGKFGGLPKIKSIDSIFE